MNAKKGYLFFSIVLPRQKLDRNFILKSRFMNVAAVKYGEAQHEKILSFTVHRISYRSHHHITQKLFFLDQFFFSGGEILHRTVHIRNDILIINHNDSYLLFQ